MLHRYWEWEALRVGGGAWAGRDGYRRAGTAPVGEVGRGGSGTAETGVDKRGVGLVDTVGYMLGGRVHQGLAGRDLEEHKH